MKIDKKNVILKTGQQILEGHGCKGKLQFFFIKTFKNEKKNLKMNISFFVP